MSTTGASSGRSVARNIGTMQLVVITGISGSGKSLAIHVLEDAGYFCIDNLPVRYLRDVASSLSAEGRKRIAVSIDARIGTTLAGLREVIEQFRDEGADVKVLFLNARTQALVQRYSETRRRHPLSVGTVPVDGGLAKAGPTLEESIENERELMAEVQDLGATIDTSDLHPNVLRAWVREIVQADASDLLLLFESFAFKHGIPLDADLVFDVRCLPNPYYDPSLRPLSGLDAPVIDYLNATPDAVKMVGDVERFLREWIPNYRREHRHYLTIAIGCTGGQHRSVFVAQSLANIFAGTERVLVRHRTLAGREHGAAHQSMRQTR